MVVLWSAIEVPVAIICACSPAMRQLFVRVFPNTTRESKHFTSSSQRPSKSWYGGPSNPQSAEDRARSTGKGGRRGSMRPLVLPDFEMDLLPGLDGTPDLEGTTSQPGQVVRKDEVQGMRRQGKRISEVDDDRNATKWYDSG